MAPLLTMLFCVISFGACFGQMKYEPQILILAPNELSYEKVFEKEISDLNTEIKNRLKKGSEEPRSEERDKQIETMLQNEIAFAKTLDFSKQTSFIADQYLSYRFFEVFPNLLIVLKDIKCNGDIAALKRISDEQQCSMF